MFNLKRASDNGDAESQWKSESPVEPVPEPECHRSPAWAGQWPAGSGPGQGLRLSATDPPESESEFQISVTRTTTTSTQPLPGPSNESFRQLERTWGPDAATVSQRTLPWLGSHVKFRFTEKTWLWLKISLNEAASAPPWLWIYDESTRPSIQVQTRLRLAHTRTRFITIGEKAAWS